MSDFGHCVSVPCSRVYEVCVRPGFAQKVANLICFLCGLCVSLRLSALKGPLTQRTQRYAEGRRGKTSISTRFFVQSRSTSMTIHLGHIHQLVRYPVKSMAGVATDSAFLGWHGL